jgi:hypothetical protein
MWIMHGVEKQREAEQVLNLALSIVAKRGDADDIVLNDQLVISCETGPALCSMLIRYHRNGRTVMHAFWNPSDAKPPFFATFQLSGFWKNIIDRSARSLETKHA